MKKPTRPFRSSAEPLPWVFLSSEARQIATQERYIGCGMRTLELPHGTPESCLSFSIVVFCQWVKTCFALCTRMTSCHLNQTHSGSTYLLISLNGGQPLNASIFLPPSKAGKELWLHTFQIKQHGKSTHQLLSLNGRHPFNPFYSPFWKGRKLGALE